MVFERVRRAVADILNCDESLVLESSGIFDDLGASSLDAAELIAALEEEFHISVSEGEQASLRTVGDLVRVIESK